MHGIIFSFVHAVVILAGSFFVLSFSIKQEAQWLKTFGFVVAVLLWVSAALVFGKGVSGHDREGREHFSHFGHEMREPGPGMAHMMPGKMNPPMEEGAPVENGGDPEVNRADK